jgi:DNA-directed RNA polymerase subunit RPC12/RpoP
MELDPKHILTAPNIVCPKCGSKVFIEAAVLKRLSSVLSPSGKEELVPIPVFACAKCGTIPDEYMSKYNAKQILGENTSDEENKEEPLKSSNLILP